MVVFLLTAVPLGCLLIVALMGAGNRPKAVLFTPAIRGGIYALPVYGLFSWLGDISRTVYQPFSTVFFHLGGLDIIGPAAAVVVGALIFCRRLFLEDSTELFVGLVVFASGFFAVSGVIETIFQPHYLSMYDLFLLPATRLGIVLVFAALTTATYSAKGVVKFVWAASTIVGLVAPGIIPALFVFSYDVLTVLATIVYLGLSSLLVYLLQGRHLHTAHGSSAQ